MRGGKDLYKLSRSYAHGLEGPIMERGQGSSNWSIKTKFSICRHSFLIKSMSIASKLGTNFIKSTNIKHSVLLILCYTI